MLNTHLNANSNLPKSALTPNSPEPFITSGLIDKETTETNLNKGSEPWEFKTKVPAKITDASAIYPKYRLEGTDLSACFDSKTFQKVIKLANDKNWPKWFRNPNNRKSSPKTIEGLKVYMVCELSNKYILFVPKNENGHLVKSMRPDRDFFMVFFKTGVEILGKEKAPVISTPNKTAKPKGVNFENELNELIKAYPGSFASIRGAKIEDTTALGSVLDPKFECSLPLEGAEGVFVIQNKNNGRVSITAEFKEITSEAEALQFYEKLQLKLQTHNSYPFGKPSFTYTNMSIVRITEVKPENNANDGTYSGINISLVMTRVSRISGYVYIPKITIGR